jgi:lipid-A-disaccharide synthase
VDPALVNEVFDSGVDLSREPLPDLLASSDLALVCSGTASLEAALAGVPHELVYRTGAFNSFVGKRLLKTRHIGLSNLILGRTLVREHLQDDASPLPLSRSLLRWVARPSERQEFYGQVRRLRGMCGRPGVWERTAEAILAMARERS